MKKNILLAAVSALLLSFCSCSDFLDRYPKEELSDASFWKIPKDAEMFVADIYNVLPDMEIDGAIQSDDAVHGIKWAAGNISKGIYDPADMGWSYEYAYIRKCNTLLEKIDLIENYNESDKNATKGEARFFRAYLYFGLIRSFGDVPYIDRALSLTEMDGITRTPRTEIYKHIMDDLDFAIQHLPDQWPESKYGRVTKGAARAMKARAALHYADWNVAAEAAKAVIDSKQYELFDADNTGRYAELFWESEEACSEAIFVKQFNYPDKNNWFLGWECFPTLGWGGIDPTQSLVDAFECIDGAPISQSPLYKETDPFKNRDPRLEVCVLHDGEEMYGVTIKVAPLKSSGNTGIANHGDATATGYYQQKWLDPNVDPVAYGFSHGRDWHVIRFAEVLLTYAEAKNEVNALDPSAFEAVNRVRRRVGMPELQNTDASKLTYCGSQDALRQRIRNEWRVEYALEGDKRQWDIRRWGIAEKVLNAPFLGLKYTMVENDPNAAPEDGGKTCILYQGENIRLTGSRYEPHNLLYPIPQSERDLNPALAQNEGY